VRGNAVVLKPHTTRQHSAAGEVAAEFLPRCVQRGGEPGTGAPRGPSHSPHVSITAVCEPARVASPRRRHQAVHLSSGQAPVVVFDDADPPGARGSPWRYFNADRTARRPPVLAGPRIYDDSCRPGGTAGQTWWTGQRECDFGRSTVGVSSTGSAGSSTICPAWSSDRDTASVTRLLLRADRRHRRPSGRPDHPEEIFGPVITVQRFDDEDRRWLANGVEYALGRRVTGPRSAMRWPRARFGCV